MTLTGMTLIGRRRVVAAAVIAVGLVAVAACSSDPAEVADTTTRPTTSTTTTTTTTTMPPDTIVMGGQGNNLDAYAGEPEADGTFRTQRVITTAAQDSVNGLDINAQICPFRVQGDDSTYFVAGEDTGQPEIPPGWGIFRLDGARVGELSAEKVSKLTPTYQPSVDGPENYGCGVLSDGRIVTTDVGNQVSNPGDGQLIVWFGPLSEGDATYCKLDVALPTAQSILVRQDAAGNDELLVATARGGVFLYRGPFPTTGGPEGGCGQLDPTGAPLADSITKSLWLAGDGTNGMATPAGLAPAPDGGVYVSSVFSGVINEYDADATFRRTILKPPDGEVLGEQPFSTGTPLGIGVDGQGNLFYADIGITVGADGVGPGENMGTMRRIAFDNGEPQPPVTMNSGLAFPDGIGVIIPPAGGGGGGLLIP